ncbi:mini-chromosome maintenance complex-binding protein-like [Bidens hawaiensis]|uniref:mini-chromosome maintenance complex-binding protein-like n=1 Tax=Bidens hawaiensis TaxID=980011 RepID=UPI00404918CD
MDASTEKRVESDNMNNEYDSSSERQQRELKAGLHPLKNNDTWNTNKFTDVSQFPMGSSSNTRAWERRLLCCVPVPGQNSCYLMAR